MEDKLGLLITAKDQAQKTLQGLQNQLKQTGNAAGGAVKGGINLFKDSIKSAGDTIKWLVTNPISLLLGGAGLGGIVTHSINAASELEKAMVTLEVVAPRFGADAKEAQEAAKNLGRELRIGTGPAAEALQRLLKSGLNIDQATELMQRFANEALTGKSASMSLGDAVMNLAQGYQTEMSALMDRAGISENISTLMQKEADAMGVKLEQLSEAERSQLKYNAFIKLTNETLGASDKFIGTYTDNMAILRYTVDEFSVALGQKLMPIANEVVKALIPFFQMLTQKIGPAMDTIGQKISDVANVFRQKLEPIFKALRDDPKKVEAILVGLAGTLGVVLIPVIWSAVTAVGAFMVALAPLLAIGAAIGAVYYAFLENMFGIKDIFEQVVGAIQLFVTGDFNSAISEMLGGVAEDSPLVSGILNFREQFIGFVQSIVEWLAIARDNFMAFVNSEPVQMFLVFLRDTLGNIIQNRINILKTLAQVFVESILPALMNLFQAIKPIIEIALPVFGALIAAAIAVLMKLFEVFTAILGPALQIFGEVLAFLINLLAEIINFFVSLGETIANFVSGALDFMNWLWTGISNIWNGIMGTIQGVINAIVSIVQGGIDLMRGIFQGLADAVSTIWNGIKDTIEGIFSSIGGAVKSAINGVISIINDVIGWINGIIDDVNNISGKIGVTLGKIGKVPMLAKGVRDFEGGMAIINENGKEAIGIGDTVYLPKGADVYSAQETRRMMGQGEGGTTNVDNSKSVTIQEYNDYSNKDAEIFLEKIALKLN